MINHPRALIAKEEKKDKNIEKKSNDKIKVKRN
jgi:hypothetical protein